MAIASKVESVVLLSGARTPTGKFGGSLSNLHPAELGGVALKEAIQRAGVQPEELGEIVFGNVVSAGLGQNIARQVAHKAGVPFKVPSFTVNQVCASSSKAVISVAQSLTLGVYSVGAAGGTESMSRAPYLLTGARWGYRLWNNEIIDALVHDGLWCAFNDKHMGTLAELIAEEMDISREERDRWAIISHQRAHEATENGKFKSEIVPIEIKEKKSTKILDRDETIRPDTSMEKLAKLPPVFKEGGRITAGNSPGLCDGASAMILAREDYAEKKGLKPIAKLVAYSISAREPEMFTIAPSDAIKSILEVTGTKVSDWDLFEINEAFAVVAIANAKLVGIPEDKLNVWGGALALGHAIGSSGTRISITLINALRDRGLKRGISAICHGGGGAIALAWELV